jgi:hypothetical protein
MKLTVRSRILGKDTPMTKLINEYKSPSHKVLAMLHQGREKLRLKYKVTREDLRVAQNQVRAVESSRAMWRGRAEAAEEELRLLKKRADNSGQTPADVR